MKYVACSLAVEMRSEAIDFTSPSCRCRSSIVYNEAAAAAAELWCRDDGGSKFSCRPARRVSISRRRRRRRTALFATEQLRYKGVTSRRKATDSISARPHLFATSRRPCSSAAAPPCTADKKQITRHAGRPAGDTSLAHRPWISSCPPPKTDQPTDRLRSIEAPTHDRISRDALAAGLTSSLYARPIASLKIRFHAGARSFCRRWSDCDS